MGEVAHRDRPKITILGVGGKKAKNGVFQEMVKNGFFWDFPKIPQNGKNGIFQDFHKMAKNGVFGKRVKNGVFGKMGYFAKIVIAVKNGDFWVFGENGEKWKSVILTDLGKNVKKGDFLTICHMCEKGGNTVFPGISVLGKKMKMGVFEWKLIYSGGNLTEVDLFLEEFLEVEDYSGEKSEEWNQMRRELS